MNAHAKRDPPPLARRWPRWKMVLLVVSGWIVLGLLGGLQAYYTYVETKAYLAQGAPEMPNPLQADLIWSLRPALTWALLTPAIWWLVRRFPPTRPRAFGAALLAGLVFSVIFQLLARALVAQALGIPARDPAFVARILSGLRIGLATYAVSYAMAAGACTAFVMFRRLTAERERSARHQLAAVKARLQGLQAQLHPHFLFNTLHAISTLVTESPPRAVEMIARLGELLRESLQRGERGEVRMQEELEFVERYLAIEQVRFGDRLKVEWSVAPQARDVLVPAFFLQPLVENAVQHGIARSARAGGIVISALFAADGTRLRVEVANTGPPGPAVEPRRAGLGLSLANLRARLEAAYGRGEFEVSLASRPETGGALAVVSLPARHADATPPPALASGVPRREEAAVRPC